MSNTAIITVIVSAVVVALVAIFSFRAIRERARLSAELKDLRIRLKESAGAPTKEDSNRLPDEERTPSDDDVRLPVRNVFLSYHSTDLEFVTELQTHLAPIVGDLKLTSWSESFGQAGSRWVEELHETLDQSAVIVAVVSPNYLASPFVNKGEFKKIVQRDPSDEPWICWVPARPSAVESTGFADHEALFSPDLPLSTLTPNERELAYVKIAGRIAQQLTRLRTKPATDTASQHTGSLRTEAWRLEKIQLRNMRCFSSVSINLDVTAPDGNDRLPSLRTVIVGDNSTGKSTLLRAIGLGVCDESGAAALLKKMSGRMVRTGEKRGRIELVFRSEATGKTCTATTEVVGSDTGTEIIRKSGDLPPDLIVAGYGTQRTRSGTYSHERYDAATAVATLFDNDTSLQNPELVLLRQPRWIRWQTQEIVAGVLGLDASLVELNSDGLRFCGSWGKENLGVLSDGYRSTAQWLLDFISWLVYAGGSGSAPEEISAIVLIDELEQHLHPHWQRNMVSRLREFLPNVQFLITSHSPLIASSITGIAQGGWREKLLHFGTDENGSVTPTEPESLRGMTVEQVLASPAFDYLIEAEPSIAKVFAEASRLATKGEKRNKEEDTKYERTKKIVADILAKQDPTLVEQDARRDLHRQMQIQIKELEETVFGEEE